MGEFDKLFSNASDAFNHPKIANKARKLAYGNLTCMGRHTISGMITSGGHQFLDWSSF